MDRTAHVRGIAFVATAAMAVSMLPLFVLGALGPAVVASFGIAPATLGLLVAAGFLVATALSVPGGALVDRLGPRKCLSALFLLSGIGLFVVAASQTPWMAMAGVAVGGVPQALANPATNKIIAVSVPDHRRSSVLGIKQSGVQLGAFVAGAPLAGAAALISWRVGVAALAASCVVLAVLAGRVLPADPGVARSRIGWSVRQPRLVWGLAVFSLALGVGIVSVNTYLAVYATQRIGVSEVAAGSLVAVLGVAGIVGRIGWSRVAGQREDPVRALAWLAGGAVVSLGAIVAALQVGGVGLWLGAAGIGLFAVAANAVSMLAVVRNVPAGQAGQASAVVSGGFFAGFAVGPLVCGSLLQFGYAWMWCAAAVAFAVAGVIGAGVAAHRRHMAAAV